MVSSSSMWVRPLILGMYTPMPAPLSRSHSVYHICCIPEGPAKAMAPTMSGKSAAAWGPLIASCGKYPKANRPVIVAHTNPRLPTSAAMIVEPITSTPIKVDKIASTTL